MRFFSSDPQVPGIISVGQEANGIFAFGQMATGFVAVGQLARGVFVVGQLAVGVVGIGQAAACVGYGVGMVGIAGRGWGIVLRVAPKFRRDRGRPQMKKYPHAVTLPELAASTVGLTGTLFGRLRDRVPCDAHGAPLAGIETSPMVANVLHGAPPNCEALLVVRSSERLLDDDQGYRAMPQTERVITLVDAVPWTRWPWPFEAMRGDRPAPPWELIVRALGLCALAIAWWLLVGDALLSMITSS